MSVASLLTENIRLKLLSLLFAVVLVAYVALDANDEVVVPLEINVLNLPAGLTIQHPVASRPLVKLGGRRILLIRQQFTGVRVSLDLAGALPGRSSFNLQGISLKLNEGVSVHGITPAVIDFLLIRDGKTDKDG